MYQARVRRAVSPQVVETAKTVEAEMWALFEAIGTYWRLTDDTDGYRGRLQAFMANRVSLDVGYLGYYALAVDVIADLLAETDSAQAAYDKLFTTRASGGEEDSDLAAVKTRVVDEFIAWRLALGGFRDFGALNYRGYFGGANLPGAPVPYRPRDEAQ
ncbi:hypothetical protein [Xanthobacter autotrophicus]|uniref:hypothetical protein n=1 Tax=Xanthobacter autotrophicus TaxID=280 RepID=UPI0037272171